MNATDFVANYIAAWNRQDSRAIAEHLSESGVYSDIPIKKNLTRDEFIAHLDELFLHESRYYELVGEVLSGESSIAFQYKAWPRDRRTDGADEDVWYGAEFITLRGDTAAEIADYYEQSSVPAPGSPLAATARADQVKRYAKSGLTPEQLDQVKRGLTRLMEREQTFLKPNLTLPELAEALDSTVNHVSQAINAGFGVSFFDYLNGYRVRRAMELLREESERAPTVLSVALEVGFSSTSTFYVAFKKVTGQTPAEFRRAQG